MRVLVAVHDRLFGDCFSRALAGLPELQSTTHVYTTSAASALTREQTFDLAVVEISSEWDGFGAAIELRELAPAIDFVFVGACDHDNCVKQAIALGARGYILKDDSFLQVAEGMRLIEGGGDYFSPAIRSRLGESAGQPVLLRPRCDRLSMLNATELRVLIELAQGASLKEAAARLNLCYKTADCHKTNLMQKLDIHDRVQLALFAVREGLVGVYEGDSLQRTG